MSLINFIYLSLLFMTLTQLGITVEPKNNSEELNQILYESYQDNPNKWPALHYAILQEDVDTAQYILKKHPEQAFLKTSFATNHLLWKVFEPAHTETVLKTMNILPHGMQGPTALYLAVNSRSVELVTQLLELGCDPNAVFISSEHLRTHLVDNGHAYESTITMRVLSPLYKAIEDENLAIVQLLLDHGAETDNVMQSFTFSGLRYRPPPTYSIRDLEKKSAMALALKNDLLMKTLISHYTEKKVAIDEVPVALLEAYKKHAVNHEELPPLYHAIVKEDEEAFLLFLQYGEDPNKIHYQKGGWQHSTKNALYYASLSENPVFLHRLHEALTFKESLSIKEIVQYTEEYQNNELGWPLLHYAISKRNLSFAQHLIKTQPEQIHLYTPYKGLQTLLAETLSSTELYPVEYIRGPSALILAIRSGSIELVQSLLALGADPNAGYLHEISALETFQMGSPQSIRTIKREFIYKTPLNEAIKLQNVDVIKSLVAHGASIENSEIPSVAMTQIVYITIPGSRSGRVVKTDYYYTVNQVSHISALSKAVQNEKILRVLISHYFGNKQLPEELSQELIEVFVKHQCNENDLPPLHHAIVSNDVEGFLLLMNHGADPDQYYIPRNAVRGPGETAIELALKSTNPLFFEKLGAKVPASINAFQKLKEYITDANFDGFNRMLPFFYEQSFIELEARSTDLLKLAISTRRHDTIDLVLATFSFDIPKVIREDDKFFEGFFKEAIENRQMEWFDYLLSKKIRCNELFLMTVRQNDVEIVSQFLKYEQPSQNQIKEAIQIVLSSSKINRELLQLLKGL